MKEIVKSQRTYVNGEIQFAGSFKFDTVWDYLGNCQNDKKQKKPRIALNLAKPTQHCNNVFISIFQRMLHVWENGMSILLLHTRENNTPQVSLSNDNIKYLKMNFLFEVAIEMDKMLRSISLLSALSIMNIMN